MKYFFLAGALIGNAALVQGSPTIREAYYFQAVPLPVDHELVVAFPETLTDADCKIDFNAPRDTAFVVDSGLQIFNLKSTSGRHVPFIMKHSEGQLAPIPDGSAFSDYFMAESSSLDSLVGMRVNSREVEGTDHLCYSEPVLYDADTLIPDIIPISGQNLKLSLDYAQTQVMFSSPYGLIYFHSQVSDPDFTRYCDSFNVKPSYSCSNVTRYGFLKPDGKGKYTSNFLYGGRGGTELTQPVRRNNSRFMANYPSKIGNTQSGTITTYHLIFDDSGPYLFGNSNFNPVDLQHQAVGWADDRRFIGTSLEKLDQQHSTGIEVDIAGFDLTVSTTYTTKTQQLCLGRNWATYGLPNDPATITCEYFTGIKSDMDYYIPRAWPGIGNSLYANVACKTDAINKQCTPFTLFFSAPNSKPRMLKSLFTKLNEEYGIEEPIIMNARAFKEDGDEVITLIVREAKLGTETKVVVISSSSKLLSSGSMMPSSNSAVMLPLTLSIIANML